MSTPPPLQPPVLKEKTHYIFLETLWLFFGGSFSTNSAKQQQYQSLLLVLMDSLTKIIKVITNYLDGMLMEIMILQLQIALHITIQIALHTCRRSPTSAGRHSLILT